MRGYVKLWRTAGFDDLGMPDAQYKIWMALQLLAFHEPHKHYQPGDVSIAHRQLQQYLQKDDGRVISATTIAKALADLETSGYVTIEKAQGKSHLIHINRWHEMQGQHASGHDFHRFDPPTEEGAVVETKSKKHPRPHINYHEYLKSEKWQSMRLNELRRARYRCRMCSNTQQLNVHHNTYERLGNERKTDLIVLCRTCHALFHQEGKLPQEPAM